MVDADVGFHFLLYEGDDVSGWDPWRAETRGDVGGAKIGRLNIGQGADIALIGRIELGRGLRRRELGADSARKIPVSSLPRSIGRIAEDCLAQLVDHISGIAVQQLGDMVDVNVPAVVQHNGERICRRCDGRRGRRRDHAFGKDRTGFRRVRLQIIVLDRGDQPAIGVITEGRQVWLAMSLLDLASLGILLNRDDGVIDRSKIPHEARPGDTQPHLQITPGPICFLRLQHLAHRIADGDQLRNDPDMLFRNAIPGAALADRDRYGRSVEHLHQALRSVEEETTLADGAVSWLQVDDLSEQPAKA